MVKRVPVCCVDSKARVIPTAARLRMAMLAALLGAPSAFADVFTLSTTDNFREEYLGVETGDRHASHSVSLTSSDPNYLRNNLDGASFSYLIRGQASADSTFNSLTDRARVFGDLTFDFTLAPALWDITVTTRYKGVVASETSAFAYTTPFSISSSGTATGLSSRTPFLNDVLVENGANRFSNLPGATTTRVNALPGSGSIKAALDIRAGSDGGFLVNGGEAFASFGMPSMLGSFSLDDTHFDPNDGATVTLQFKPHFNMSGQTINGAVTLQSGEVVRGSGAINGSFASLAGSVIDANSGQLTLGNSGAAVSLGGSATIQSGRILVLSAAAPAVLTAGSTTRLFGGTLRSASGVVVNGLLHGFGNVASRISGQGEIRSEGVLELGDGSAAGVDFNGTLRTGFNLLRLRDSNGAQLGGNTVLGGGTLESSSAIVVTGELSGSGSLTSPLVDLRNVLSPGSSAGRLSFSGNLLLGPAATLEIELGGLLRGSQYDALNVAGTATLDGLLDVSLINGFVLDYAQLFAIIDAASLLGEFDGLGEGGLVGTHNGLDLFITYRGGDGNDVFLYTAAAIPEPQTYALLVAGLGLLGFAVRRRRALERA